MRAPLDSSKDSSNNFVTGREPETTSGPLFSDDPSYQLFIHMLINFGTRKLSKGIDDLDPSMQIEINEIIEKINEYYEAKEAYQAKTTVEEPGGKEKDTDEIVASEKYHSFLVRCYSSLTFLREKAGAKIPEFPSLLELTAEFIKKENLLEGKEHVCPPELIDKVVKDPFEEKYRLSAYSDSFKAKYTEFVKLYFNFLINNIGVDYKLASANNNGQLFNMASAFGTVPILKAFVARGVDPTSITTKGETALFYACRNERPYCLEYLLLLLQEIDITALSTENQTCLHRATAAGLIEHVKILFKYLQSKQAERPEAVSNFVNQQNEEGRTVLHYAAEQKDEGMVTELGTLGINPLLLDYQGESAAGFYRSVQQDTNFTPEIQNLFEQDQRIRSGGMFRLFQFERRNLKVLKKALMGAFFLSAVPFVVGLVLKEPLLYLAPVFLYMSVALCFSCNLICFAAADSGASKLRDLETASRNVDWASEDIRAESAPQEIVLENQPEGESGRDGQGEEEEEEDEGSSLRRRQFFTN